MIDRVFLNRYKVVRLLGEGGMSRIYLARHLEADEEVAVKVLREDLVGQPRIRDHFQREYYVLSRFQHPNAVGFYGADLNDPQLPFIVMEYIPGLDLSDLLQRRGPFNPERVGRLLVPLCSVLLALHDAGIVHRDLKPANLKVRFPFTSHETIKLMDFGLAKITSMLYIAPEDVTACAGRTAVGTPEYICPEQARDADMDHRGDLYSVGVILFEMLTGKRPFERDSVPALMNAHATEPPPTFAEVGAPRVPPAVEAVVRWCLAKNPGERPQSALELVRRYEKALGSRPATLSSPAAPAPTAARAAAGPSATAPGAAAPAPPPPIRVNEPGASVCSLEARMPESMAMLKLRGFIHDQGGTILDSAPGRIRVRLSINPPAARPTSWGISSWQQHQESTSRMAESGVVEMELHLARKDPAQPNLHAITLVLRLRSRSLLAGPEWRNRCKQIQQDLQTYLLGCS